ncbi:antitoxin Xre/MbcA/ParS toxin-binding domain-containing protein [Idiomarina loihiensis]|uniref:type II RES/Xre toxin-antitoxin system antitoxin n=1 Tax=Idiomarina loihiensis TaxID=135577 RepID=UPI0039BDEE2E
MREYIPVKMPKDIWGELHLPRENTQLRELVVKGFPVEVLYMVASMMGVTQATLRDALRIPSSTFQRRRNDGRFSMKESNRLYCLIEILTRATDLFDDDRKAAVEWMTKEVPGLGYNRPVDMLDTHVGTQAVLDLISRLEYGVHS